MTEDKDFYKEPERAKVIFLDLFLYAHGMAVLTATKKLALDRKSAGKMLMNILSAFIKQENPGCNLSI